MLLTTHWIYLSLALLRAEKKTQVERKVAYGICVWIQVSFRPQITGFHSLHPIQMKNGFFILPRILILHLNAGESGTYACLDWVARYSSIYKTLRALCAFGNSILSPKAAGHSGKNLNCILSPFPLLCLPLHLPPWLNRICALSTSASSYLNSKHCGPCFMRSTPCSFPPSPPFLPLFLLPKHPCWPG